MKKFIFRLQKVLDFRNWRERIEQQNFAEASVRRESAQRELDELVETAREHNGSRTERVGATFTAGDALMGAEYTGRLSREISAGVNQVQERDRELDLQRDELIAASMGRKVIEKLRERKLSLYEESFARVEQAILDDVAGQRHTRSKRKTD